MQLSQNFNLIYCVYFPVYKNSFDNKIDFEEKKLRPPSSCNIGKSYFSVCLLEIRKQLIS